MILRHDHCSNCGRLYFFEPSVLPGMHTNTLCFTCLAADRSTTAGEVERLEGQLEDMEDKLGESEEEVGELKTKKKGLEVELKTALEEVAELEGVTKQLTAVLEGRTDGE